MRIKLKYQLLSFVLIVLPILFVLFSWNRLPSRLPLHFDEQGQLDQVGTRPVFLHLAGRQMNLRDSQRVILYLLTSGFMAGGILLLIGQGVWGISLYREWMPVLFFLFGFLANLLAYVYLAGLTIYSRRNVD